MGTVPFAVAADAADVPWIEAILTKEAEHAGRPEGFGVGHWTAEELNDIEAQLVFLALQVWCAISRTETACMCGKEQGVDSQKDEASGIPLEYLFARAMGNLRASIQTMRVWPATNTKEYTMISRIPLTPSSRWKQRL